MRRALLVTLLIASAAGIGFGSSSNASIHVAVTALAGKHVHLVHDHLRFIDAPHGTVDDSAVADESGSCDLHCVPNDHAAYEIISSDESYESSDLFLAAGDTLSVTDSPHGWLGFTEDRRGRNRWYTDVRQRLQRDSVFYEAMLHNDCHRFSAFVDSMWTALGTWILDTLGRFATHPAMRAEVQAWVRYQPLDDKITYLMNRYWNDDLTPVVADTSCFEGTSGIGREGDAFQETSMYSQMVGLAVQFDIMRLRAALVADGITLPLDSLIARVMRHAHEAYPGAARGRAVLEAAATVMDWDRSPGILALLRKELGWRATTPSDRRCIGTLENLVAHLAATQPGEPASEFVLPDTAGKPVALASFAGKTVYLHFWGTWCEPCLNEFPALARLHEKFRSDTSVVFLGVQVGGPPAAWKKIVRDSNLTGVQLCLAGDRASRISRAYNLTAFPSYWILKNGRIVTSTAKHPVQEGVAEEIRGAGR